MNLKQLKLGKITIWCSIVGHAYGVRVVEDENTI